MFVGEATGLYRYPVRIFTPTDELPFAGHPVIATAHLLVEQCLAERGCPLVLEAGVGPLVVELDQALARLTTAEPFSIPLIRLLGLYLLLKTPFSVLPAPWPMMP